MGEDGGTGRRVDAIEDQVLQIIADTLHVDRGELCPEAQLGDFDFDSLDYIELQSRIEDALGVTITRQWATESTIAELAKRIRVIAMRPAERGREEPATASCGTLTDAQWGLWYEYELRRTSSAYHIGGAVEIIGLDADLVCEALTAVFCKIPNVHSRFRREGTGSVRIVQVDEPWDYLDLDGRDWSELMLRERLLQDFNRPIELERMSPFRVRIIRRGQARTIVLLVVHHIACDFRSLELIQQAFSRTCVALREGRSARPVGYPDGARDFMCWQEDYRRSAQRNADDQYWTERLSGAQWINWSNAGGRSLASTARTEHLWLDQDLKERVLELARSSRCTPFVIYYAIFALALAQSTGQTDVCVGTPVTTRRQSGFEDIIGYYANTILLRTQIDFRKTLTEYIASVQRSIDEALDHSLYPLWRIPRAPSPRTVCPQVLFTAYGIHRERYLVVANALQLPDVELQWGDWTTRSIPVARTDCQCDLMVTLAESGNGTVMTMESDPQSVGPGIVLALQERFHAILREVVQSPDARLSELELLSTADRAILDGINETAVVYPDPKLLHQLSLRGMRRCPSATAVRFHNETLTFQEVSELSGRVAGWLGAMGVQSGNRVALCVSPGPGVICALLGILRIGATFVPIAPAAGGDWIATILDEIEPIVVLVNAGDEGRFSTRYPTVPFESCWLAETSSVPDAEVDPQSAAYIMYTSGTTGRPKGVVVSHLAICNRLLWMRQQYPLREDDCVLQKTPYTFDVCLWEFFLPLIAGIPQVVVPDCDYRDPEALVRHLVKGQATIMHFVPSVLKLFLNEPGADRCRSLRRVFCSGEALLGVLRDRFFAKFPEVELHNLYGPTEAAVDATFWACDPSQTDESVPIGFPIANLQVYVLDEARRRVPPRVIGDLYLSGVGLANGYWRNPELTSDRFICCRIRGCYLRLYKTGDRVSVRPDGALCFVGRNDRQVKIGGVRIELGAIEAAILRNPRVTDCAVVVDDSTQHPRIEAYISGDERLTDLNELRLKVQSALPASHQPHVWIRVDELPLTSSGKLDLTALKQNAVLPASRNDVLWMNPREALLAGLFTGLLDRIPDSPTADFFELGGDSLRALQLRSALADAGYDLPLPVIFETPALRSLASRMTERSGEIEVPVAPFSLLPVDEGIDRLRQLYDDAFPLSRLQQGLIFHSREDADYEVYILRLSIGGRWCPEEFRAGLARLASRHPMLRVAYEMNRRTTVQCVHRAMEIPLEIFDHTELPVESRRQVITEAIEQERRRRFDWTRAPLIRLRLDRQAANRYELTVSHPVLDGWSLMVLITELLADVMSQEGTVHQSAPAEGMPEFVRSENLSIKSAVHLEFWKGKLARRSVEVMSTVETPHRIRLQILLDPDLVKKLRLRAIAERLPFKSVLLSIQLAVQGWRENSENPATGLIINGRPEVAGGERAVGIFLNTVLMSVSLRAQTWRTLAAETFATERELWAFRHFPYSELQRLGGGAPFDSVFNFVNFHIVRELQTIPGLQVLSWDNPSDFTFFPLAAYFVEDPLNSTLAFYLDYDQNRYSSTQMRELAEVYRDSLQQATHADEPVGVSAVPCSSPGQPESRISGPVEHDTHDSGVSICAMIEDFACRQPNQIALHVSDGCVTYGQLWRSAEQIASALQELGLGREEVVAVRVPRAQQIQGMLGVMMAGGAFLLLNPDDESDRSRELLKQSRVRLAICDEEFASRNADLIRIETGNWRPSGRAFGTRDSLAYLVTTSGSTGTPKGVEVEHSALKNTLNSLRRLIRAGKDDHWLSLTPVSFDISILELLLPILSGACVTLVPAEDLRDGQRLRGWLESTLWTVTQGTPSTFRLAMEAGWRGRKSQRVLCGGEPLSRRIADQLLDRVSEVWNCYGPAEAAIWATVGRLSQGSEAPALGNPLPNTWVEIWSRDGRLLPRGSTGEIVLGGAGLARGYRGDPDLTAKRFVDKGGLRAYRTGDLGRITERGELQFLGRLDRQLKVHGVRMEPAEIEAALMRHPHVRAAAVVPHRREPDGVRLIAYYVASEFGDLHLYNHLADILPAAWIPAEFRCLVELPLTVHGKVNYRQLEEWCTAARNEVSVTIQPPRGNLEECLARAWCDALGASQLGRDQNLLHAGADSLLALQVSLRVEHETGRSLPPAMVFHTPTISGLARWMSRGSDDPVDEARSRAQNRLARRNRNQAP